MSLDPQTGQENELNRLPPWLRGMDGAEETPGWLRQLAQSQGEAWEDQTAFAQTPAWSGDFRDELAPDMAEDEAFSEEAGELPGWFADVDDEAAEPEGAAAVPDWLSGFETEVAQAGDVFGGAPGGDLPAWLAGFDQETAPTPPTLDQAGPAEIALDETAPDEAGPEMAEIPDWLRGIEAAAQETTIEPQAAHDEQDIPGWLLGSEEPAALELETSQFEAEEVPDWLRGISAPVVAEQPAPGEQTEQPDWMQEGLAAELPSEEGQIFEQDGTLPDWLSDFVGETDEPQAALQTPDWLEQAVGGVEPARQPTAQADLPDWLSAAAQDVEPEADAEMAKSGDIPDWLLSAAVEAGEPKADTEMAKSGDIPDWLLSAAVEAGEPKADTEMAKSGDIPDWLLSDEAQQVETGVAAPEPLSDDVAMPDWLQPIAFEDTPSVPEPTMPPQVEDTGALPDWLSGIDEEEPAPPAKALLKLEADVAPGLPDWLQDLGETPAESQVRLPGTGWLREIESTPLPQESMFDQELPDDLLAPAWLDDLDMDESAAAETAQEAEGEVLPDWLQASAAAGPPRKHVAPDDILSLDRAGGASNWAGLERELGAIAAETGMSLGGWDDLNAWIEERRARQEPVTDSSLSVETSGPLTGLRGLLTPEPLLGIFPKSTYKPAQPIPDAHVAEAQLVESILAAPAGGPVVVGRAQAKEVLASLGRWVIYLALLASMVVAAFLDKPFSDLIRAPQMEEAQAFYDAIDRLPAESVALLVIDYDAALDGELTPQLQAIVQHLAQRGVGIAALSINPQGMAIVDDVFAQGGGLVSGEDYINLGYLPPHPASLQALFGNPVGAPALGRQANPAETPLGLKMGDWAAIDLIVTVSGSADHVRWWVEQVGSRYKTDIVAGVSASIAPYVLPFYQRDHGQIKGLLIGLAGAANYEQKLAGQVPLDYAQRSLTLQGYGQLMLVAMLLLSGITFVLRKRA